jgi:hypothetical protein
MSKAMPVIPVHRVVDKKNQKNRPRRRREPPEYKRWEHPALCRRKSFQCCKSTYVFILNAGKIKTPRC